MHQNLLLWLAFACAPSSSEMDMESLGINLKVWSGESSTLRNQSPEDLAEGHWEVLQGEPGATSIEALLWTPGSTCVAACVGDPEHEFHLSYWKNLHLARTDVLTLTHGTETIKLEQEGRSGYLTGSLPGERTGEFRLSFSRDGEVVAPATVTSLSDPVLSSHADGGEVFQTDEELAFELQGLDLGISDSNAYWLVIVCDENSVFSEWQYPYQPFEADWSTLSWDLGEIYDSLALAETSECSMTLTQEASGERDPAFDHSGSIGATHASEFSATFVVEPD